MRGCLWTSLRHLPTMRVRPKLLTFTVMLRLTGLAVLEVLDSFHSMNGAFTG